jgi:hypothetical protein
MMLQPLIAAALIAGQTASGPTPCVTRQEAGDMTIAFLPLLVGAVTQRCRAHLGPTAFLATRSEAWVAQLRRDAEPRRQSAMRGLTKVMGAPAPAGVGGEAAFDLIAAIATAGMLEDVTPAACADIDRLAESLAPLPSENIATIVSSTLSLAGSGELDNGENRAEAGSEGEGEGERPRRRGPMICPS